MLARQDPLAVACGCIQPEGGALRLSEGGGANCPRLCVMPCIEGSRGGNDAGLGRGAVALLATPVLLLVGEKDEPALALWRDEDVERMGVWVYEMEWADVDRFREPAHMASPGSLPQGWGPDMPWRAALDSAMRVSSSIFLPWSVKPSPRK